LPDFWPLPFLLLCLSLLLVLGLLCTLCGAAMLALLELPVVPLLGLVLPAPAPVLLLLSLLLLLLLHAARIPAGLMPSALQESFSTSDSTPYSTGSA
jgi:hypothetical protein